MRRKLDSPRYIFITPSKYSKELFVPPCLESGFLRVCFVFNCPVLAAASPLAALVLDAKFLVECKVRGSIGKQNLNNKIGSRGSNTDAALQQPCATYGSFFRVLTPNAIGVARTVSVHILRLNSRKHDLLLFALFYCVLFQPHSVTCAIFFACSGRNDSGRNTSKQAMASFTSNENIVILGINPVYMICALRRGSLEPCMISLV